MIPRFFKIPFCGTLWVERQKIPLAGPFILWNNCNGELLAWVGRWHLIYTPRHWSTRRDNAHRRDSGNAGEVPRSVR